MKFSASSLDRSELSSADFDRLLTLARERGIAFGHAESVNGPAGAVFVVPGLETVGLLVTFNVDRRLPFSLLRVDRHAGFGGFGPWAQTSVWTLRIALTNLGVSNEVLA